MDIENLGGVKPAIYSDYRKMFEDKYLDVISIVTPDYWHALMTYDRTAIS